jgi:alpha-beta hydrolase superfamily lysophospholipase
VQAIIRAIDRHAPGLSKRSLEAFMRDVYLYTTNFAVKDAINAIVAKEMTQQPTIVVGHSLGSVVAYNVLKSDENLNVPLYVSLGCPLGIRTVTQQFRPVAHPASVRAWYNAFDKRDVVALTPLDAANFPVTPPIENHDKVDNQTDNRHGIIGYLNDKSIAERILNAVGT